MDCAHSDGAATTTHRSLEHQAFLYTAQGEGLARQGRGLFLGKQSQVAIRMEKEATVASLCTLSAMEFRPEGGTGVLGMTMPTTIIHSHSALHPLFTHPPQVSSARHKIPLFEENILLTSKQNTSFVVKMSF